MSHFCTKCNINWLTLYTVDAEDHDDQYEVCPRCRNDFYLTEGKEGEAFMMDAISGEIYNPLANEEKHKAVKQIQQKVKAILDSDTKGKQEQHTDKHMLEIERYQAVYEREGKERAEEIYFNNDKTKVA